MQTIPTKLLKAELNRLNLAPAINGRQAEKADRIRRELADRDRRQQAAQLSAAWDKYFFD